MGSGGSGGGALSYKEPPHSKLKKLWATDPPEQNSKPGKEKLVFVFTSEQKIKKKEGWSHVCVHPTGAMSSGLRLEDSTFYDFLSPGPSPLSPPGQPMGSVGDGWPPRANSPPPHGNTVTWPPGTITINLYRQMKKNIFTEKMLIRVWYVFFVCVQSSGLGSLGKVTPTLTLRLTLM